MYLRMLHILGLVCALIVSGQGAAFAAASDEATGKIAICTGFGTHVIFVDENGKQTTPPQLCADAFKCFVALPTPTADVARPSVISLDAYTPAFAHQRDVKFTTNYAARGPPIQV